jgi:hypothetical protein
MVYAPTHFLCEPAVLIKKIRMRGVFGLRVAHFTNHQLTVLPQQDTLGLAPSAAIDASAVCEWKGILCEWALSFILRNRPAKGRVGHIIYYPSPFRGRNYATTAFSLSCGSLLARIKSHLLAIAKGALLLFVPAATVWVENSTEKAGAASSR